MTTARKHDDGELPAALNEMHNAIHDLTEPQTQFFNGHKRHSPSLYRQLQNAVPGEQGSGGGVPRSIPPLWIDAAMLLQEIDLAVQCWQPQPDGIPPTVGRLRALDARSWRPQDTHSVEQITSAVIYWTDRITALLDPQAVKTLSAPCPACAATSINRRDSGGENIRTPALQLITELGCQCLACHTTWKPWQYPILAKVLQLPTPQGVTG